MTTNHQSTFENDHLQVTLKKEPGCKVFLDVIVNPKATQASYQKAIALIRKDVSVPGFRKGKAPEAMILQNYQKHVEKEWKDVLLNTSLEEAIHLVNVFPFNRNSIKTASIKSASREEGSTLVFEYEAAPNIPTIAPETLSIRTVEVKSISEKDVEESIEELTVESAEWNDLADHPVQEGDYVVIDIDDIGEPGKNICTDSLFFVKSGKMGKWMRKLLIGMTPGQIAEGMSEKESEKEDHDCKGCEDETHDHHNTEFIPTLCRITLHGVRQAKPHPIDDILAKKYGASSVEELKERIKISLEKRAVDEQKDQLRTLIEKELLTHYPFDMPASLVQGELKLVKKSIISDLRIQGVEESKIATEAKKIEEEAANKYDRDFRLYFLTQKYARENNIQVSQDDIMMEMMRQMWLKQIGKNTLDTSMDPKEVQSHLQLQLLALKAIDEMIEKATKLPKKT